MAYSYNTQTTEIAQPSKFNALAEQLGKVVNVGLYPIRFEYPIPSDIDSATALYLYWHTEVALTLYKAYITYTEGSGVTATQCEVLIGKESDTDYYFTGALENSKAQYYTKGLTLLQTDLAASDTLIIYISNDAAAGAGKVIVTILAQYAKTAE